MAISRCRFAPSLLPLSPAPSKNLETLHRVSFEVSLGVRTFAENVATLTEADVRALLHIEHLHRT